MRIKIGVLAFAFFFAVNPDCSLSYDGETHRKLNEQAVEPNNCSLDERLREQLGVEDGIDTEFKKRTIKEWIAYGGEAEDYGWRLFKKDPRTTRAFNHFHDPLEEWDEAGLKSLSNALYLRVYSRNPVSTILWGLNPGQQDFFPNSIYTGDWSWGKAREYYYGALTKQTEYEREEDFADCFRALGQVMHLLQDMSVPLHTRNDVHILPIGPMDAYERFWTYETYVKKNIDKHLLGLQAQLPSDDLLRDSNSDPDYSSMVPISGFFDRNQYNIGSSLPQNDTIGLAEYSNANFFTKNTMWKYQHPSLWDTNATEVYWDHPELVNAEDGKMDPRVYIKFKDGIGVDIQHLAAVDYFSYEYRGHIDIISAALSLDKECWEDYADKLIPRAVGYSTALLDYFFRGKMEVISLPFLFDNRVFAIYLKTRNVTPSEEVMKDGFFWVVCRYTPEGGNPDGSDDVYVKSLYVDSGELQYNGDWTEFTFDFSHLPLDELIPVESYDSVECMLVFRGTLGNEEGAVVGKSFNFGDVKFNEEWDNGLYGTYIDWRHSTQDNDGDFTTNTPGHGVITNEATDGILIKENTRYGDGYYNENRNLSYYNYDALETNHILITPDTYLHMNFDNIWMTPSSTDPPNDTSMLISFKFKSNGLLYRLAFVQTGYPYPYYANPDYAAEVIYSLDLNPGYIIVLNFFDWLENAGITFSEPVYMNSFYISQYVDAVPTDVEITAHMEVDFIRIIDSKTSP